MVFEAMLRVGALLQAPAIASGSTEMASVYYLSKYISKGSTDDKRKYATLKFHDPARAGWNLGTKGKCKGSRKRCPRCPMRVCNCSRLHMFARFTVHRFFASNLESIITDVWTHSGQGVFLVARHK